MNWYKFSQSQNAVYIRPNEIRALEELNFLPKIPSDYRGFYYLLPLSQVNENEKEAWKNHAAQLQDVSPQLHDRIVNAIDSNQDLSIIGLVSSGRETKTHEEVHERLERGRDGSRMEMIFRRRDPQEVNEITNWLTKHGYSPEEVPGEYYAYILSQPNLVEAEPFKLTEEEFRELRSLGLQVPEEAKRKELQ
jgi:hypothetical protein